MRNRFVGLYAAFGNSETLLSILTIGDACDIIKPRKQIGFAEGQRLISISDINKLCVKNKK